LSFTTTAVRVGVLGLSRSFVLGRAPDREGEPALCAEALRPLLVGGHARREGEDALVDELLSRRRRILDVTGDERDLGAGLDQLRGTGLLGLQLVVAHLDLEIGASGRGDLLRLDLGAGKGRRIERLHAARQVDGRPDDDRRLRGALAGRRRRSEYRYRRRCGKNEDPDRDRFSSQSHLPSWSSRNECLDHSLTCPAN
jgi:hypothetical protein